MRRSTPRRRGYTLLELAIVIGVAAILAATIVPDAIESMKTRMAEKAAADVMQVHDAARLFFVQNTDRPERWPGEDFKGKCAVNFDDGRFRNEMVREGYLATSTGDPANPGLDFMVNPWERPYEVSVYAPATAVTTPACLFGVTTAIPAELQTAFTAALPQSGCGPACPPGPSPAGYVRCCSFVSKPGAGLSSNPCPAGRRVGVNASNQI
ncbi:MAG: type II secretion system protein, partial [Myxococcaceae bacterium]|nr:type II secretion system protein [Myxococcaceae bacterium]